MATLSAAEVELLAAAGKVLMRQGKREMSCVIQKLAALTNSRRLKYMRSTLEYSFA
jgi:3,4-dihydroxy-2-butanone 4-phosphate synthase